MENIFKLVKLSFYNLISIKNSIILMIVCFSIASIFNPVFSVMLMGMMTYTMGYQTMAYEDSYGVDYLISYLPVTKKEYVISRYLFSILSIIISALIFSITYFISIKLNILDYRVIDYKTNILMGITSSIGLVALYIPVMLKYGIKKSRFAMTIIFMLLIMVPSFFMMSIEESEVIRNIIYKINQFDGNIVLIVALLMTLTLSYIISIKIYSNKEIKNV